MAEDGWRPLQFGFPCPILSHSPRLLSVLMGLVRLPLQIYKLPHTYIPSVYHHLFTNDTTIRVL